MCGSPPARRINFLYDSVHGRGVPKGFLNFGSAVSLAPPAAIFSSVRLAPVCATNAKTNRPTPATSPQGLSLICTSLYIFLIRSET